MKLKNIILIASLLQLIVLQSCNDADYKVEENKLYIEETGIKANQRKIFVMETNELTLPITPKLSNILTKDIKVKIEIDKEYLDEFNKINGTAYTSLPENSFELLSNDVSIEAGKIVPSTKVFVKVNEFTDEMKNSGKKYALPLRLISSDDNATPIAGADKIIYALDLIRYASVPILGVDKTDYSHNKALADFSKSPISLENWTIEFRLKMDGFSINNQAVFNAGADTEVYVRYGDAPIPFNQFQVKFAGSQINSFMGKPDKWHHIALTYDGTDLKIYLNGVLQNTLNNPGQVVVLEGMTGVCTSGSTYFRAQASMNEVRIWNVCRSESEIKENFYVVAPDTPGLVSYWKMNEGEGLIMHNTIKGAPDMIAHDANENPSKNLRWEANVKILNDSF